ncbi:hypothetical protein M407DRAFT_229702 [Tulasnella calospora MUT 4182]|uniref:Uncharacterized protein n=1 Tax=Tulasnella calospora MUT 4182 TaxID=1051891 RepID=A0A0C3QVV4_9AGAM|nr:hypothetical protein M407DRAFT_229702 [Tulasnella calospora MUT 4182]
MCKDDRINHVTNGKALQIWTEILDRLFMEIREINAISMTGQSTRRKRKFVTAVLAEDQANGVTLGGIFLDRPYWPEERPIRIADVWSALLLVLSLAADCDTSVTPPNRQPDWYLELLISSGIIMRAVATAANKSPPLVLHILWDARNHFLVQSTAPNVESEASNLPIPLIIGATPPGGGIQLAHTHALIRERGVLVREVLTEMGQLNMAKISIMKISANVRKRCRISGLRVIHEAAFIAACERCGDIVARAEWDFRQYTCREGRSFMMNTQGEEVQDD